MAAGQRVELATRSTQEGVMDPRTRLMVFKMVNAGVLLEVSGVASGWVMSVKVHLGGTADARMTLYLPGHPAHMPLCL